MMLKCSARMSNDVRRYGCCVVGLESCAVGRVVGCMPTAQQHLGRACVCVAICVQAGLHCCCTRNTTPTSAVRTLTFVPVYFFPIHRFASGSLVCLASPIIIPAVGARRHHDMWLCLFVTTGSTLGTTL